MTLSPTFIGVLVAVCGNSLIGVSFPLTRMAHEQNTDKKHYVTLPLWRFAMVLCTIGELGNLVAYSLARPSLVSPLGAVSVVVNSIASWYFIGETLSWVTAAGSALCIGGGVGVVHVAASQGQNAFVTLVEFNRLVKQPEFAMFITLVIVGSVVLIASKKQNVVVYVMICSLLGTITVLGIKALSSFLILTVQGPESQFHGASPWICLVLIACALYGQVHYLNLAFEVYGTNEVVPAYYVCFTALAVMGSAVLFRDLDSISYGNVFVFMLSLVAAGLGVFLVSVHRANSGGNAAGKGPAISLDGAGDEEDVPLISATEHADDSVSDQENSDLNLHSGRGAIAGSVSMGFENNPQADAGWDIKAVQNALAGTGQDSLRPESSDLRSVL